MESAGNAFNFDIVKDRCGSVIKHPDDLVGDNARRPSTYLDDAYEIITRAPLDDAEWYDHVALDTANLYQGTFGIAMAIAARDDPLLTMSTRLQHWAESRPEEARTRFNDANVASAQRFAAETLQPKDAAKLAAYVLPRLVSLSSLSNVIERHLDNPVVNTADPEATIRLIVYGETRSKEDTDGNLSYVLANYIPPSLQTRLEQARYDIIGRQTAGDLTRLRDRQKIADYWPAHPHAAFDPTIIASTKLLKYSHLLADIPSRELSHRAEYDADISEQTLEFRQQRVADYLSLLQKGTNLHALCSSLIGELAQRKPDELQMDLLTKFYYAAAIDKIVHYQYCVAEPDSPELEVFRSLMSAIPERIFSEDAETDREASQLALQHFYDPEHPEDSRISPPLRITFSDEVMRRILSA